MLVHMLVFFAGLFHATLHAHICCCCCCCFRNFKVISHENEKKQWNHHLISQSLNLDGHRGTTDNVATIPFHLSVSSAALRESSKSISVHSLTFFPSLLLSSSPSCSFHCPLQNCLRHARGSWDVAIPSEFPFLHDGLEIIMHSNCILDYVANLLVHHMVFVGNVQRSPIALHL